MTTLREERAELALARVIDGCPTPDWEPTLRANSDAHWMIRLLRAEGYKLAPIRRPTPPSKKPGRP